VRSYQEGFVRAIEAGDGLAAALHTPAWVRLRLDDARLLLLYSATISCRAIGRQRSNAGCANQAQRFEACWRALPDKLSGASAGLNCGALPSCSRKSRPLP